MVLEKVLPPATPRDFHTQHALNLHRPHLTSPISNTQNHSYPDPTNSALRNHCNLQNYDFTRLERIEFSSKSSNLMGPSQSLLLLALSLSSILGSSTDYSSLVFKGCADQNFQNFNGVYRQTLQTLFNALISQSSSAKFYKTTSGDGTPAAVSGLFQCRGDISGGECNNCVKKAPNSAQKLCGEAIAARVQLNGCYLRYEIAGFRQVSGVELLYKICGSNRASGAGFGDRLDLALGEIVKGVASGGFYAGAYQSVYVLGQCEGDLSSGDCVSCVKTAIDKAKSECGSAISAQIYLQTCYISYTYYPNGVATNNQQPFSSSGGRRWNSEKIIAIALGGLVGVGLVAACLLFTKSAFKKKQRVYKFGG